MNISLTVSVCNVIQTFAFKSLPCSGAVGLNDHGRRQRRRGQGRHKGRGRCRHAKTCSALAQLSLLPLRLPMPMSPDHRHHHFSDGLSSVRDALVKLLPVTPPCSPPNSPLPPLRPTGSPAGMGLQSRPTSISSPMPPRLPLPWLTIPPHQTTRQGWSEFSTTP